MKENTDIIKEINELRKEIAGLKHNRISVADFEVESSSASLTEIENTINRLIDRNKQFSNERSKFKMAGGIGIG